MNVSKESTMCSVESLREFVTERLTAAAEEIFGVFEKKIVEYEEEIDRQRRLLDVVWKPGRKRHALDLPQHRVCEQQEEEVFPEQQLCNPERSSSLDQEDPEPPQIKEEQEELCTSQEGEQLDLKQEMETFTLTSVYEESENSEADLNTDVQVFPHSSLVAESQDQIRNQDSEWTRTSEPELKRQHKKASRNNKADDSPTSETRCNIHTDNRFIECEFCGKAFKYKYNLKRHLRIHTGEKPYVCNTCGKRYSQMSILKRHTIIHTGEKPYSCKICRKRFCQKTQLKRHMNTHIRGESYT